MAANHAAVLKPFVNKRCSGHREDAYVCNRESAQAAQSTKSLIVNIILREVEAHSHIENRQPLSW
eukprot:2346763-Pyramimonas_sp.AAC.1